MMVKTMIRIHCSATTKKTLESCAVQLILQRSINKPLASLKLTCTETTGSLQRFLSHSLNMWKKVKISRNSCNNSKALFMELKFYRFLSMTVIWAS